MRNHNSEMNTGKVLPLMLVLVSAPIVLITVLLMQQRLATLSSYQKSEQDVALFASGLALISAGNRMRDLAPLTIHLDDEMVLTLYQASQQRVEARLEDYLAALQSSKVAPLQEQAEQLASDWEELTIKTGIPLEDVSGPFENVNRFFGQVYASLGTLLYASELSGREGVSLNEVLTLPIHGFRSLQEDVGLIRALAMYADLRGGYLGDADMRRLEFSGRRLESQLKQLNGAMRALSIRTDSAELLQQWQQRESEFMDFLIWADDELVLAPQITVPWQQTLAEGEQVLAGLEQLSSTLLVLAEQLYVQQRQQAQRTTVALAVVLTLLYLLIIVLTLLLLRSHYRALGARVQSDAQSQFLARMSHEIRTPLNGVLGLTELLRETEPTPRQQEYISLIESAGRTLNALVNDVLDYAKIEAGQMQLEQAEFDPVALLIDCAYMFNLPASDNGTLVLVDSPAAVPSRVLGDAIRLRQIIINLLSNAIKFTLHGRVLLSLHYQPAANDGQGEFLFKVSDTGIGLSEEEQRRLFQRFSQASSHTSRRYGGSGLGLSISRELVAMMGGDINLDSAPGRGAHFRFTLSLPVVSAAEPLMEEMQPEAIVWDAQGNLADWLRGQSRFAEVRLVERLASLNNALEQWPGSPLLINGLPDQAVLDEIISLCQLQSQPVAIRMLVGMRVKTPPLPNTVRVVRRSVLTVTELQKLLMVDALLTAPSLPKSEPIRPLQRSLRVLVAEDNPVNQMVTKGYLNRLGITDLQLVEDGQQALEQFRDADPGFELVLMDLDMPVMDGFACSRAIRAYERQLRRPPSRILALSAHALPQHEAMIRDAGMDGQLIKPLTLKAMQQALEGYLGWSTERH